MNAISTEPDWDRLGFGFVPTDRMYRCIGDLDGDEVWGADELLPVEEVSLSPSAGFLFRSTSHNRVGRLPTHATSSTSIETRPWWQGCGPAPRSTNVSKWKYCPPLSLTVRFPASSVLSTE